MSKTFRREVDEWCVLIIHELSLHLSPSRSGKDCLCKRSKNSEGVSAERSSRGQNMLISCPPSPFLCEILQFLFVSNFLWWSVAVHERPPAYFGGDPEIRCGTFSPACLRGYPQHALGILATYFRGYRSTFQGVPAMCLIDLHNVF